MAGALAPATIAQYALSAGLTPAAATIATAIAMAESGGNPTAAGDQGTSYGLWQVHYTVHPQFDPSRLFDPSYNAMAMAQLSGGGVNWSPWSTYTNGAYNRYLDAANQAVSSAQGGGGGATRSQLQGSSYLDPAAAGASGGTSASTPHPGGINWVINGPLGTSMDLSPVLWAGLVLIGGSVMLAGVGILVLMALKGAAPAAMQVAAAASVPGRVANKARSGGRSKSAGRPGKVRAGATPDPQKQADDAENENVRRALTRSKARRAERSRQDREDKAVGFGRARREVALASPSENIPF